MSTPTPTVIEFLARGLVMRDDRVLVCRNLKHGHCYLPGGHIEPGEAAADALLRELDEEAGLGTSTVGSCLLVEEHLFEQRGRAKHELNLVFHVELPATLGPGCPPFASREPQIAFEWVAKTDLAKANLKPEFVAAWITSDVDLDKTCWRSSRH